MNDKGDRKVKNELLYGFKAYKGYFVLGDYLVALGAYVNGYVSNMDPAAKYTDTSSTSTSVDDVFTYASATDVYKRQGLLTVVFRSSYTLFIIYRTTSCTTS